MYIMLSPPGTGPTLGAAISWGGGQGHGHTIGGNMGLGGTAVGGKRTEVMSLTDRRASSKSALIDFFPSLVADGTGGARLVPWAAVFGGCEAVRVMILCII